MLLKVPSFLLLWQIWYFLLYLIKNRMCGLVPKLAYPLDDCSFSANVTTWAAEGRLLRPPGCLLSAFLPICHFYIMNQLCSFSWSLLSSWRIFWENEEKLFLIIFFHLLFQLKCHPGFYCYSLCFLEQLPVLIIWTPGCVMKSFAFCCFFHEKSLAIFFLFVDTIECIFQQLF